MKLVLVALVILVLIWLARGGRRRTRVSDETAAPPPAQEAVVACPQCGLHLPRSEALPGRGGLFCSEAHRAAYERANHAG